MLKYPDGKYSYAYRSGRRDAWLELRPRGGPGIDPNQLGPLQVMQIEDEVEFLLSNLEFIVSPDIAISTYLHHRMILFVLLMFNVFFEMQIAIYTYNNSDAMIEYRSRLDPGMDMRGWTENELRAMLFVGTFVNSAFNALEYSVGFYALFTHKVTNYQIFNTLMLLSIFVRILLTYFNILNVAMLILKMFTYVYSRYTLTLLFRVLIWPNDANGNAEPQIDG